MPHSVTTLTFPTDSVAVITFCDPDKGANILSRNVVEEFATHLTALENRVGLEGLVIRSGKPGIFIAGADVREFAEWIDTPPDEIAGFCRRGQQLFGRLAEVPFVTVAAIDGLCLGGGSELALWCDRRLMTTSPKTAYGFPEVKLGIFPGWGGTARTPRMIGLANAVELVTSGESIDAGTAHAMGLAEDICPPATDDGDDPLLAAALRMIAAEQEHRQFLADRRRWAEPISLSETELGFLGVTANGYIQQQTKGHYPAPLAALEVMLGAAGLDVHAACEMEAEAFSEIFGTAVNRALLNVFFLQDANKKDPGVAGDFKTSKITSASVIGAGVMGQGIAAAAVKRGVRVNLTDARLESLESGVQGVLQEVAYDKKTKGVDASKAIKLAPLINGTQEDQEVAAAEIVIEAIFEDPPAKRELYARLEPQLGPQTILASNTSTIPITTLARDLAAPERFCGVHFFNPVRRMPLVEIIRGEKTSDATIAAAVRFAKQIGKSPIVVADGPGFLVNRLLLPYMNEALELVSSGVSLRDVDKAATKFGMPMGPIRLYDVVGLDVAVHAGSVMHDAFPDRVVASETLAALYQAGRLGQKTGRGFYNYENKKRKPQDDPEIIEMLAKRVVQPQQLSREEITDRLFLPMITEATRILQENIVRTPGDVDLGLIYGIGFPPFRGGLLHWADTIGAGAIVEKLKKYESIGSRYAVTDLLAEMATENRTFYP